MIMCAKEEDDGKVLKWTLGLRVTLLLKFMDKVVAVCTFVIRMEFKMLLAVLYFLKLKLLSNCACASIPCKM